MHAQPLIVVHDVQASSRWYQSLLGCESSHGGPEYEQIFSKSRMVLQLHRWDAHEHPHMGNPDSKPYGNGVLLWFQTDEFNEVIDRANALHAEILEGPRVNLNANHREVWLRDPDGYVVVIAGPYGDLGAPQPK
jgi:catechol 2,3-dioxygenase-like lactoylglutathione lyase family enzyme